MLRQFERRHDAETDETWDACAERRIKGALERHRITYSELARRLTDLGLPETEASVAVRIERGRYPAWWLFAVLRAMGVRVLLLD